MLNEFLLHVTTRAVSARDARNCTSSLNYSQLCLMGVLHIKAKNACYWETLVISQVSVRNYFFYFTSILVSTLLLGRNYCCKCCLRKQHIFHFTFTFAEPQGHIFPLYPSEPAILHSVRCHKKSTQLLPFRNWHGHTSVR